MLSFLKKSAPAGEDTKGLSFASVKRPDANAILAEMEAQEEAERIAQEQKKAELEANRYTGRGCWC